MDVEEIMSARRDLIASIAEARSVVKQLDAMLNIGQAQKVLKIRTAVAEYYSLPVEKIAASDQRGSRKRVYAWPRQMAAALAQELLTYSIPQIAHAMGYRDHTAAMYSIQQVHNRREKLSGYDEEYSDVRSIARQLLSKRGPTTLKVVA